MTDFDSPWKEVLELYFDQFMAFFFPQAHADIDWGRRPEFLDKELQQIEREAEQGRGVVDKLVRVWLKDGQEQWVLIHVEVQSQYEADFGRRMYVYNYRLFDRYNRIVVSLAVLGDDRPGWRPDWFGYGLWGCSVAFLFPVAKLLEYVPAEAALEVDPNPFATVVLAHLKTLETRHDPEARRGWKTRLVRGLYERGLSAQDVRNLFRFIDWLMNLPPALENLFWQEVTQREEDQPVPYVSSSERVGEWKGLLMGIEAMLKLKFGAPGLHLMPEIREIGELEVLRTVLKGIESAATPEDVRRLLNG